MPDEILVVILSCLPLKDAARTSLLSSRWTNVWRHSLRLNFDIDDKWHKAAERKNKRINDKYENLEKLHEAAKRGNKQIKNMDKYMIWVKCQRDEERENQRMRDKYMNWVNSVLRSHKALTLDEFRICFDLVNSNGEEINKWLEFAFERRVQRLDLSLVIDGVWVIGDNPMYEFPAEYLRHFDVKPLKALCLRGVDVGGEDIEVFLHECPFLEELIVQGSRKMSKAEVCGSSLALKHLEIFHCFPWSPIKISAPKLTSLKVDKSSTLLLDNVPNLVEFDLVSDFNSGLLKQNFVHGLHCYISQLETLTFGLDITYKEYDFYEFPKMPKLKKLVINFEMWYDGSLEALDYLMRASPRSPARI